MKAEVCVGVSVANVLGISATPQDRLASARIPAKSAKLGNPLFFVILSSFVLKRNILPVIIAERIVIYPASLIGDRDVACAHVDDKGQSGTFTFLRIHGAFLRPSIAGVDVGQCAVYGDHCIHTCGDDDS